MNRVTVRIKSELYKEYQIYLIKSGKNMKEDLTQHIESQLKNYSVSTTLGKEYSNMEYSKLNFEIDKEVYKEYKILMIQNNTTPTADIIRYIMEIVKE